MLRSSPLLKAENNRCNVSQPAGVKSNAERGAGAGLQIESHAAAGPSPHPARSPAWQAGGTRDEPVGGRMGPAGPQRMGNGFLGATGEYDLSVTEHPWVVPLFLHGT